MIMDKPTIWTYWEGTKPEWVDTCLRSVEHECKDSKSEFHLVTPETLWDHIPIDALHPNHAQLPVAQRVTCYRAALLATHGGLWMDADTLGVENGFGVHWEYLCDCVENRLSQHGKGLPEVAFCAWHRYPYRILNGYIWMSRGSRLAQQWLDGINALVAENVERASRWCALGEGILTPLLSRNRRAVPMPLCKFLPLDIDACVEMFFLPIEPARYDECTPVVFGMNHSWFMYHKPKDMALPRAEWKDSPLLIHKLLHRAEQRMVGVTE